ncbi:MAG: Rieske (2Fe-2S) protein [Deltaproteobacteria bacterium]|nr:Rieske (2Fe-2S) protein [Deltaproteobacteria bacterium]
MDTEDNGRRSFLKKAIFFLSGLIGAGLAVPSGIYFLSPIWKKTEEDWIELGPVGEIPKREPIKVDFVQRKKDGWVTVEGRSSAWVITADGQNFTVFDPHCTHLGCPYRWDASKKQFLCPCHNAAFGIDGEVLAGPPPRALDRFASKVVGGKLLIRPLSEKKEG